MKNAARPPGPKARIPLGHLFAFRRDVIGFLARLAAEHGDVAGFRIGPMNLCLVSRPDLVRDILTTHHQAFVKGRPLEMAKHLLGDGLLTSEGELHRRQRRMIQPMFHRERIQAYGEIMATYANRLSRRWRHGETEDIFQEMMRLALAIAGKTMFDSDVEADAAEVGEALTDAMRLFGRVAVPFSELLLKLPLPSTLRFRRAKARLDTIIYRLISRRRLSGLEQGDLLSLLLAARDDEGDGAMMTDTQVRDEALIFFLAAHDTTALTLTWTWYLLSQHPAVEATLHRELDTILGDRLPEISDLSQLRYTNMVFAEALRLYPPGYVLARQALTDYAIDQYVVPKGTLILMSPYLMHRDPRYYTEPERFDPLRWETNGRGDRPKLAYFPFGGGPRVCIGESFALMEGTLVLSTLAQHWRMRLVAGHPVELLPLLNLRPKHGMRMILEQRKPWS
jgi:cytochrome P450